MNSVLFAPHNDDETLFAAYTCLRHRPLVVICFQSVKQEAAGGVSRSDREAETAEACAYLGVHFEQWEFPDDQLDPGGDFTDLVKMYADAYEHCFYPRFEPDGHEQHNLVGMLAGGIFGQGRGTAYLTYRRGEGRTRGVHVPYRPEWPAVKLRAMACYASQVNDPATQPWFANDWIGEWYA